jgi:homoserine dehydrogenase
VIAESPDNRHKAAESQIVNIALAGCGTIGGALARLLLDSRDWLQHAHGLDLRLSGVLVRDVNKPREAVETSALTSDVDRLLGGRPDIVIEALGGLEPAATLVAKALGRGIHVVSANKTLIAQHGQRLQNIARHNGAALAFEASVGAAVPVLAALRQRRGDAIRSLRAVLNGTCNFVLCRMAQTGCDLATAVSKAVSLGLAEPDPSADISGRDSAEKLCILARAAGFEHVKPADIAVVGIAHVTPRDVQAAREHGCVIRLIAEIDANPNQLRLNVGPAFVPITHPLAKACGAENVFVLDQQQAGRLVLHGEGAGPGPTAAAILADLLRIVEPPVTAARSARISASSVDASRQRSFVRLPRDHVDAPRLRRIASHVHLERDRIELVVPNPSLIPQRDCLHATMLAAAAP